MKYWLTCILFCLMSSLAMADNVVDLNIPLPPVKPDLRSTSTDSNPGVGPVIPSSSSIPSSPSPVSSTPSVTSTPVSPVSIPATSQPPLPSPSSQINPSTGMPFVMTDPGLRPFPSFTPQDQGPKGTLTGIGDPGRCWICDDLMLTLSVAEKLSSKSVSLIADRFWLLMVAFAGVSILTSIVKSVILGRSFFNISLGKLVYRIFFVSAIFLSSGLISKLVTDIFISLPIQFGSEIGSSLGSKASQALGARTEQSTCTGFTAAEANVQLLAEASISLRTLVCNVHVAASTGMLLGGMISTHPTRDSTNADKALGLIFLLLGLSIMAVSFLALLKFGLAIIESVLITTITACFLPFLIMCYMFESTKSMIRTAFENVFFTILNLSIAGVAAVLMVFIMMTGMVLGLDPGASVSSMTIQQIVTKFSNLMATADITEGEGIKQVARFASFSLTGFLLATRIMVAGQTLATEISGYALGESKNLSNAAQGSTMKLGGVMATAGTGAAASVLGGVGSLIGKGASSALSSSGAGGLAGRLSSGMTSMRAFFK